MAYTRLLRAYYRREKTFADEDEACRLVRATSKVQKAAVRTVLVEFFEHQSDGWHNKRADEEVAAYQSQCAVNKKVGSLGGRPKKTEPVTPDNPIGSISVPENNPNQEPLTTNHQKTLPAGAFLTFWDAWPNHHRKSAKGKCFELWKRKKLEPLAEQIVAHIGAMKQTDQWRDGFVPAPIVYLNKEQWDGAEINAQPTNKLALYS